jgi:DNA-directed RNA polymerase sigma subunit (sigma70/sigma32)
MVHHVFLLGLYANLNAREMEIVVRRLATDDTLDVVARTLYPRISRERVRQIEAKALKKMRNYILNTERGRLNYGR